MLTKDDVRRMAMQLPGVTENAEGSYHLLRDGRGMIWPYPERVHPKRARVLRYDQFLFRVADEDDKVAMLTGEPDIFFTTDHYNGYHTVIVRLDAIDEERLRELVRMAWDCAPLRTIPKNGMTIHAIPLQERTQAF